MKVAISGASGFVGTELTDQLAQRDVRAIRLVRSPEASEQTPGETVLWDPTGDGLANPELLEDLDVFFHLAGRSIASRRWNSAEKQRIRSSRVDATKILASQLASLEVPPRVMVSASAIGIYGPHGDAEIDESTAPANDFLAEVAQSWEAACEPLRRLPQTRVVHPRLGVVLGPGGGALRLMLPLFRCGLGGRVGSGSQYFSWVSLRDCVRALLWMADESSAAGVYNVVAPTPLRNAQYAKQLAAHVGRPLLLPAPALAVKLALGEEMANALVLNSQRVCPRRLLDAGFVFEDATLDAFFSSLT